MYSEPFEEKSKVSESYIDDKYKNSPDLRSSSDSLTPERDDTSKQKQISQGRSRKNTAYFRDLVAETAVDKILEKNELTDDELLLLSRKRSGVNLQQSKLDEAVNEPVPIKSSSVYTTFKSDFSDLRSVFERLADIDNGSRMSYQQFMSWDEIKRIVESGQLTEEEIYTQFCLLINKEDTESISLHNFPILINQLDLMGSIEQQHKQHVMEAKDALKSQQSDTKPESAVAALRTILTTHFLFDALSSEDIASLIACMKPLTVSAGEDIIRQNEDGDLFYCIESGTADVYVIGVGHVGSYTSGDSFGELALIQNVPRAATVTATSKCHLWTIERR
jgi:hypothetical protein